MEKIKTETLIKIAASILMVGLLVLAGKNIYDYLSRAQKVDQALVETYRPTLNISLIKKAADTLEKKE